MQCCSYNVIQRAASRSGVSRVSTSISTRVPLLASPSFITSSTLLRGSATAPSRGCGRCVKVSAASSPGVVDRALAAAPYLLPFLDAFSYGRFLFYQYPFIRRALSPVTPLVAAYTSIPFAALIAFFAVYIGIINNQSLSRFTRFNAMQAVLLDILLVLPRLVENILSPPAGGWGAQLYITAQNTIWVFIAVSVVYGIVSCLLGQTPRIPLVADAADQQVR